MKAFLVRWVTALFHWFRPEISPNGEVDHCLQEIEAVVGVPFGTHSEFMSCGVSNRQIAAEMIVVRNLSRRPDLRLIAQWEIADRLLELGEQVLYTDAPKYDPHVSTRAFFRQLRGAFPDMRRIAVVAHPLHALRCKMAAERLGFEVRVLWTSGVDYDPTSVQRWCRSPWLFIPWEFASRILFLLRGWM